MTISHRISGVLAGVTIAVTLALPLQAETLATATPATPAVAVKSAAGTGETRFDWLNPGKGAGRLQVAAANPPGNGSWICSPSGFGSKSRCYHR